MYRLLVSTFFSLITFATVTTTNAQSLEKLTPVDNPFEYQNEYYPITVGNYWKMVYLSKKSDDSFSISGYYEYRITGYALEEIYFGDSLKSVPVFKKECKYFKYKTKRHDQITYSYLIKTNEGVIESKEFVDNDKIKPFLFIPSDSSFDYLSLELTGMRVDRDVELKTRFWSMNTIRLNYNSTDHLAGFFYSLNKGHVYTQFFNKTISMNTQTNIQFEDYEPKSEFILSEFKIE